jgi:hypothetical protein
MIKSMKLCGRCKDLKILESFGKNAKKTDGLQDWCRQCVREYNRIYYVKTPEKNIARLAHKEKVKLRNRKFIFDLLRESTCHDCASNDWRTFEFDHVNGNKIDDVSRMVGYSSLQKLQEEIDKCVIRCANCHRIKTFNEQQWYKDLLN